MSAHQIATAIEDEAAAFCRLRFRGTEDYLEAKDAHCQRITGLIRQLRCAIGTTERLGFAVGRRGSVEVAVRRRA